MASPISVSREIGAGQAEAAAFRHARNQVAALRGTAQVDDAEAQIINGCVERESEQEQLQGGRQDE
jgi:hypothetical protein